MEGDVFEAGAVTETRMQRERLLGSPDGINEMELLRQALRHYYDHFSKSGRGGEVEFLDIMRESGMSKLNVSRIERLIWSPDINKSGDEDIPDMDGLLERAPDKL